MEKPYPLEIGQELDISYQLVSKIARALIKSKLVARRKMRLIKIGHFI